MGTRRLRSLWTFGSLVVFILECTLTASEAPVTNYMSNYYDDAFHEGPSKSKSTPHPSKSHPTQTYSRNGYHHVPEDIEEHHDEDDHRGEHPHSHKQPHPRDARPPPKHHHHDDEDQQEEPQDHRGPHSKSNSYKNNNYHGTYNSKPQYNHSPKSHSGKSYGAPPKTPYRSTTTGMPKYITTSGPSYTSGSSSRLPLNKVPVGSSFSSQTGPGYSYSYGTKITEEREPENHREEGRREEPRREQTYGPYDESPPPKSTYNMDRGNAFKAATEDFKAGYTAGYPPMSSFNTVKGNFDDYGHNDLSPKSPYKPSYKPVTFSYSGAPTGTEYGSPIEEGPAYDVDDPSYSNTYEKNYGSQKTKQHKPPSGGKPTSAFFPKNQGKPKPYSSPPPKFDGPPSKHHGPLNKNYGAMKSYSGPPSSTYSTLAGKTYGKHELYHGPPKGFYSPSNGYGPPTGNSKDNYDSPSTYGNPGFSRNPSTTSPIKEHNGPQPTRMGGFQRGSPPPPPSSRGNLRPSNNRGSPGRGKRRPNNAYRYSYTAFTMFNKKRPGRGHRQGGKGHYGQGHTHGLAPKETIGCYECMDDDSEKREEYAQKNKRLFGSVGYSLGDTRTFVKTPETSSIGYSNAATYGGGYDMGTSYY